MDTTSKRAQWVEAKRRERAQREASKRDGSYDAYVSVCMLASYLNHIELRWP